jgi:hypothetical protein
MEGLNRHLEFQIKLAELSSGGMGGRPRERISGPGSNDRMPTWQSNETPDDIPDIGSMVPIEKV